MVTELKNENGNTYIYVVIVLIISSLLLNSTLSIVKINDEKKHSDNINLYYIAQSGADKFLDILNKILDLTLEEAESSEKSEAEIFNSNIKKILGTQNKILIEIKNAPRNYEIQIDFENKIDFVYKVKSCARDTENNNKLEIGCEYKRDDKKFSAVSYKLF